LLYEETYTPRGVNHVFFIFLLLKLVSSFSFGQIVTGTVTDDNNGSKDNLTSVRNNLGGGFIRRLSYPEYESSNNKANYFAAVQAIGGTDNLTIRVFWDK
jgi:hypothetical protein